MLHALGNDSSFTPRSSIETSFRKKHPYDRSNLPFLAVPSDFTFIRSIGYVLFKVVVL
jgi:hypothetical protein